MFKQTLAVAALAVAAVQATDLSSLAGSINPNLTSGCLSSLYQASQSVQGYCGVSNAIGFISGNATGVQNLLNSVYYIAENSTTLDTVCADKCGSYLNDFAYTVMQSCGSSNLLNKNSYNATVSGSDLVNAIRYTRRAICTPSNSTTSNSTYCVQDQLMAYKNDFPNVSNTTYTSVLNDANITCIPCASSELAQLQNNTSLSPYWKNVTESYVNSIQSAMNSTCSSNSNSMKRDERLYARSRFYRYM